MKAQIPIVVLVALMAYSCTASDDEGDSVAEQFVAEQGAHGFVGTVSDTDSFIAIASGPDAAIVLVAHGEAQILESFAGPLGDGFALDLSNEGGGRVTATYQDGAYSGEVTLRGGSTHRFAAAVLAAGDVAGMFVVLPQECDQSGLETGWIIDATGAQRGAARVAGRFLATPVLDADKVTIGETDYPVHKMVPNNPGGPTAFPDVCKTPAPGGPVPIPYPG